MSNSLMASPKKNDFQKQIIENKLASDIIVYLKEMLEDEDIKLELIEETGMIIHPDTTSFEVKPEDCTVEWSNVKICDFNDFANVHADTIIKGIIEVIDSYIK